jgi:hypothetical protein
MQNPLPRCTFNAFAVTAILGKSTRTARCLFLRFPPPQWRTYFLARRIAQIGSACKTLHSDPRKKRLVSSKLLGFRELFGRRRNICKQKNTKLRRPAKNRFGFLVTGETNVRRTAKTRKATIFLSQ